MSLIIWIKNLKQGTLPSRQGVPDKHSKGVGQNPKEAREQVSIKVLFLPRLVCPLRDILHYQKKSQPSCFFSHSCLCHKIRNNYFNHCDRNIAKKKTERRKQAGGDGIPQKINPTHCLINCTASSYFIPHSMSARATRTGALERHEISRQI